MLGGYQDAPAAAGVDHAQGHVLVVAPFQHGGQCNGTHGNNGSATDADHGREHRTDTKGAQRQTAPEAAAPKVHHAV